MEMGGFRLMKMDRELLVINQSIGRLFSDVVNAVVKAGLSVKLLSGPLTDSDFQNPSFSYVRGCPLAKAPSWRRILTWGIFSVQAAMAMIRFRSARSLLVTNPPLVPWLGPVLKKIIGMHYGVLVYDIYPDAMERMGLIRAGKLISRVLRKLNASSLRQADFVITISDDMKSTLLSHLGPHESLSIPVIPNWADTKKIKPLSRSQNPFSQKHGLVNKFVVLYSGAFGAMHDVETIISAAEMLTDIVDVQFVLIGGGTHEREIRRLAEKKKLPNLLILPIQPLPVLPYSLSSADCHIVSMSSEFKGISMPSKTYTSLAAGGAIIAVSPPDSDLANLIKRIDCGICVPPGRPYDLAEAVRRLVADKDLLRRMQQNARRAAETQYDVAVGTRRYLEVLIPFLKREN
jgi:glycosyltransferase involved in cell wall biosynthesis